MNIHQKMLIFSLCLYLVAFPRSGAQTIPNLSKTDASSPLNGTSGEYGSSVGITGATTGVIMQDGQADTHGAAKIGILKGSLNSNSRARGEARLCFQPGLGWIQRPMSPSITSQPPSASDRHGSGASSRTTASAGSASNNSRTPYKSISGASPDVPNSCSDTIASAVGATGAVPESQNDIHGRATNQILSTSNAGGASTWPQSDSALITGGNIASQRLGEAIRSESTGSSGVSTRGSSGPARIHANHQAHSYISAIEIRKTLRNAPDLQTRNKLRRMQARLAERSEKTTEKPGDNAGTTGSQRSHWSKRSRKSSMSDIGDQKTVRTGMRSFSTTR